jgi:hypothetical protein
MSTTGAIILPYPHLGQIGVRRDAKRFNWLSAGRRWRKTTLLMSLAIETVSRGKIYFWGAPTFDQVRIGWNETVKAANGIMDFKQSTMTATLPQTGGRIIYRSLDDPDNARGHTADVVALDEVADINPRAYYEVLRAMLMDTGGELWGVGTPKGRNWFYMEWLAAKDKEDSMSWQIPTVGCKLVDNELVRVPHPYENPDIPWNEIVNIYNSTPIDIFRQEYMAVFVEGQGAVFRNIGACMHAKPTKPDKHTGHYIVAGVDWGKQADYTAISIGCETCKCEIARDRFNQIDWHFQYDRLEQVMRKWNVDLAMIERNSIGDPGFEALQRAGLPVMAFDTTASSKPQLIENMGLALEREEWQFQADPVWTGEMEAYERKVSAITGRSQYSAPEGLHDDTVIARALMLWSVNKKTQIIDDPFANW